MDDLSELREKIEALESLRAAMIEAIGPVDKLLVEMRIVLSEQQQHEWLERALRRPRANLSEY